MNGNHVVTTILAIIDGITVTDEMDYQDEASEYWAALEAIKLLLGDPNADGSVR